MFTGQQVIDATKGILISGNGKTRFRRVVTNSKLVKRGDLFFAIVGKKHDAHDFIKQIIAAQAAGIVISRPISGLLPGVSVIQVKDTTQALGDLARSYRQRFSIPVIAITGSAGKTTTKEMVARVLSRKFNVLKNLGTENNQYGVPQTILRLKSSHDVAVIEVGTNQPGDIAWLASIVQPTMAVITNIGESHLERLKSPANVYKEKFHLIKHLKSNGIAIVNGDDPYLSRVPSQTSHKTVTFSIRRPSQYQAQAVKFLEHHVEFKVKGAGSFKIKGKATSNIYNALSAISCGRLLKIGYNDIRRALESFALASGRQTHRKVGAIHLWDDSYNANPVSFRNALEALGRFSNKGKKIVICGDMLELGTQALKLHQDIGRFAAKQQIHWILSFGDNAQAIAKSAKKYNTQVQIFQAKAENQLQDKIVEILSPGDVVLIKGSRGMRMERFVQFIQTFLNSRS